MKLVYNVTRSILGLFIYVCPPLFRQYSFHGLRTRRPQMPNKSAVTVYGSFLMIDV